MRRAFAVLATLGLLLTACKVVPASPSEPGTSGTLDTPVRALGDTVRLAVGKRASWDAGRFVIAFDTVEADSRCPTDVRCVWAGDVEARFHLDLEGRRAGTSLHSNLEPKQVEYAGYVVRLLNVEPYPGTWDRTAPAPSPVAVIVVTRE